MTAQPTDIKDLPETLPIFPLPRVLLLPRRRLPLNVFEPRYLAMVDAALKSDRMIGMIQPRYDAEDDNSDPSAIYPTGCMGRITSFDESDDGRYLITLTGLCRFDVTKERPKTDSGYRIVTPDWTPYKNDFFEETDCDIGRSRIIPFLQTYLQKNNMTCDKWNEIHTIPAERFVNCLSMICPFEAPEKQALLEARTLTERARKLCALLEMAVCEESENQKKAMH